MRRNPDGHEYSINKKDYLPCIDETARVALEKREECTIGFSDCEPYCIVRVHGMGDDAGRKFVSYNVHGDFEFSGRRYLDEIVNSENEEDQLECNQEGPEGPEDEEDHDLEY